MRRAVVITCLLVGALAVVTLGALMQREVSSLRNHCRCTGDASEPILRHRCEGDASDPILRMELARNAADVQCVLGTAGTPDGEARRKSMEAAQKLDFAFIGAYLVLFCATAFANAGERVAGEKVRTLLFSVLVGLAIAVILGAGIADLLEDRAILNVLQNATADAASVRGVALWKWRGVAGAVILQGAIVVLRERTTVLKMWVFSFLGSFAIAAGALCFWATYGQTDAFIETHIELCLAAFSPLPILPIPIIAFLKSALQRVLKPSPQASAV